MGYNNLQYHDKKENKNLLNHILNKYLYLSTFNFMHFILNQATCKKHLLNYLYFKF